MKFFGLSQGMSLVLDGVRQSQDSDDGALGVVMIHV